MSNNEERNNDADRKRKARGKGRLVVIPPCADRPHRELLEQNTVEWLLWYFAEESETTSPFWYRFVEQQLDMIAAIDAAIITGGDQAYAASRGEGKTTICERVTLKAVLTGTVKFPVLFGATKAAAMDMLDSIKSELETNVRLQADYPEVCTPISALENIPNRAHYQTVAGHRHDNNAAYSEVSSRFSWCGPKIIFPNVPGSPAAGAIIATRGLDGAVRGLKQKGKRPDLAVIDDPDTEKTAENEKAGEKLERRIDRAIGALGGQKRRIARVILTTLQSRICVSYKFTDPQQKHSWKGRRNRFLAHPPERVDLWEDFVAMKKQDWLNKTNLAHEFYLANRTEMDRGAIVSNPNRFTADEVSALEFYYSEVARLGADGVATEYDNDPPAPSAITESLLTAHHIQKALSGYERKAIPPNCFLLTHTVDVRKTHLHWVVRAWRSDGTGFTIDYGIQTVIGTRRGSDEGVEIAIYKAILQRWDEFRETVYCGPDGEVVEYEHISLVDASWQTDAVYCACLTIGPGIFPSMGFGKSAGCVRPNFSEVEKETADRKPGDGWFLSQKPVKAIVPEIRGRKNTIWLACLDSDRWKRFEHSRWLTGPDNPGRMTIFGEADPESERHGRLSPASRDHQQYAHQVVAETEVEEVVRGRLVRKFKSKSDTNHFLDASYEGCAAANMKGIRLITGTVLSDGETKKPQPKVTKPKPPPKPKRRIFYDNE